MIITDEDCIVLFETNIFSFSILTALKILRWLGIVCLIVHFTDIHFDDKPNTALYKFLHPRESWNTSIFDNSLINDIASISKHRHCKEGTMRIKKILLF